MFDVEHTFHFASYNISSIPSKVAYYMAKQAPNDLGALCSLAQAEMDSARLQQLVEQINHLLEIEQSAKKQRREPVCAISRTDA